MHNRLHILEARHGAIDISYIRVFVALYFKNENSHRKYEGTWVKGEPSGCKTECWRGVHGKAGTVTCSKGADDKCDERNKPDAKTCAVPASCGMSNQLQITFLGGGSGFT